MRVIILEDAEAVAQRALSFFDRMLRQKPDAVLGLATGSTPLRLYEKLSEGCQAGDLRFSDVTTFNLDEYIGLPAGHSQSYRQFMQKHLFQHIDIDPGRTHLPDVANLSFDRGESSLRCEDWQARGAAYDQMIHAAGGIDLQLLGLGRDGHIGFNEPGSSLASRTRIKALTRQTRADNSHFFASIEQVPRLSITMGIGSILQARQCLLMATGAHKSPAVTAMIEGPVTARVPASALQMHPAAVVILDQEAASGLQHRDDYQDAETLQQALESLDH